MKLYLIIICLLCSTLLSYAQSDDDLFGVTKKALESHKGWIISPSGNFDFPAADMAKRFGTDGRVGAAVIYKTKSNWMFGAKFDYIFGNKIKEDSFLSNIKNKYGEFYTQSGANVTIPCYERGYMIGLQAGKIWNISKSSKDNGILFTTSVGFMQHKIFINNADQSVTALKGAYVKGYDRLTNGLFVEESIEYSYIAKSGLLNFHIGPDVLFGFTKDRRDYLFDVMRSDNKQRLDVLFGIRAGWYLCIFKRKSEEMVF